MEPPCSFNDLVLRQIDLLNDGKPLEAFDANYSENVVMFSNDKLFASGAVEGRARQEPFIASATDIEGCITDLCVSPKDEICVFRNRSKFKNSNGQHTQINGLVWQRWGAGKIVQERYYDGTKMETWIQTGVLTNPSNLLDINHSGEKERATRLDRD